MVHIANRVFCAAGGVFGAAGVAAYAAASHIAEGYYAAIAPILLGHAALLVALGLSNYNSMFLRFGGVLVVLGIVLFTGDLVTRQLTGSKLFLYAAPIGGTTIILGWLMFFILAVLPDSFRSRE